MLVSDCTLPPLYALRKDQKNTDDPSIGPPVRPVCGAVSGYNRKLSPICGHVRTFGNQIKLQSEGGPIGLELTGILAQLFMVW